MSHLTLETPLAVTSPGEGEIGALQALLNCVLLDPDLAYPHLDAIPLDRLPPSRERLIAKAMHQIAARGDAIDLITVGGELEAMGCFDEVGGYSALIDLGRATPTSANAATYAKQFLQLSKKRLLAGLLDLQKRRVLEPGADADEIVQELREALADETSTDEAPLRTVDTANWAQDAEQPREDIFQDFIPKGVVAGISADPGVGKTMLLLMAALAVATGHTLQPFKPLAQGVVLCLFGEDSWRLLARRIKHYADLYGIDADEIQQALARRLHLVEAPAVPLICRDRDANLSTTPAYRWLCQQIERVRPSLVVLDPLAPWFGGNENCAVESTYFINRLQAAGKPSNATTLVSHHFNKQHETRGSTGIRAALRWHANLRPMEPTDAEKFGLSEEDACRFVNLAVDKMNDGEFPKPTWFERCEGGVLRSVDIKSERQREVAATLGFYVAQNGLRLTEREMEKEFVGEGLREFLTESVSKFTLAELRPSICVGVNSRILCRVRNGRRDEVVPAGGFFDE